MPTPLKLQGFRRRAAEILYLQLTIPQTAEIMGVDEKTVRRAAKEAGLSKNRRRALGAADVISATPAASVTPGAEPTLAVGSTAPAYNPVDMATMALTHAVNALNQGRGHDAQALIKAGLAIGDFAELLRVLREPEAMAGRTRSF